jgi:tape measure domain-containing protein
MKMIGAVQKVTSSLLTVENGMDKGFDTAPIFEAQKAAEQAAIQMNEIGKEIEDNSNSQKRFNSEVSRGGSAMDGLMGKVTGLVAAYASIQTVGKVVNLSDELTQTNARLGMLVDSQEDVDKMQQQIYESAQRSRGAYQDTADAVAKMGIMAGVGDSVNDTFKSTEELVAFTEQLNKQFTIAGTSQEGISAAMLQITQAMSSGVLRGEELNSVFEQAPTIIQSIADYMDVPIGSIRAMAQEGQLTADIVKNALLSAAEETDAKFNEMPMTWGQAMTTMKNSALMAFQPVLIKINELANNQSLQMFVSKIASGFSVIALAILDLMELAGRFVQYVAKNWSVIAPIIMGIVTALGMYKVAMGIAGAITATVAAIQGVKATMDAIMTAATAAATAGQSAFNAALYACPLTWIIGLIVALIAVIIAVIAWIGKATGAADSALGAISGAVLAFVAFVYNLVIGLINGIIQLVWSAVEPFIGIIEWILNVCNGGFDSFGGAVANLIGQIISWFLSLGKVVTTIIDAIFGTNWTDGLSSLQDKVLSWGKNDKAITISREAPQLDRWAYGDAFETGAKFGDGLSDTFSNLGSGTDNLFDTGSYGSGYDAGDIPSNIAEIADNTESLDITSEDLKYLRDIAERDVINRFTTAEIKVEMTNNNNVSSDRDLDGIVDYLVVNVREAMETAAEGVHV